MKKTLILLAIAVTMAGCNQKQTDNSNDKSYKALVNDLKTNLSRSFKPENPYTYFTIANTTHKTIDKVDQKKKDATINYVIENYEHSIKLDPHFAPAYYGLGLVLYNNKDLKGAYENFKKAVEINPHIETYHLSLGITCDKLKKDECAAQQYGNTINLNPKNTEALILLANIYFENKQYENAKELFEMALKVDPENIIAKEALKEIKTKYASKLLNTKTEEQINAEPDLKKNDEKTAEKAKEILKEDVKEELIKEKEQPDEE